jgi:hypothetical protein
MEAGMDLALELSYRQFVQRESAVALIRLTDLLAEQERFAEARFVCGLETAGPVLASVRNALAEKRLQGRRPASTSKPAFKVEQLPDRTIVAEAPPAQMS